MSGQAMAAAVHVESHYAPPSGGLARLRGIGIGLAVVGGAACAVGAFTDPEQFFRSWLPAWIFWLQIALGSLGLAMLNQLTHGAWGILVRRVFEAAAATLPLCFVLFLPIALGIDHVFEWAHAEAVAEDPILQAKAAYLNVPFFLGRAILYFGIWIALAGLARRWSLAQDRTGDPALFHRMRTLSAAGLILFVLSVTFASFDWLMSLDPHWFSSIYGVQFVGAAAVAALAFAIVVSRWLVTTEPMSRIFKPKHHQDHGTLLFAFLLLWGYFMVSQFIIIWSANLPEEITFYMHRQSGGWQWLSVVLVVLHFALPFLLLLSPAIKRNPKRLAAIAVLLLVMRWLDVQWQAAPNFHHAVTLHWLDLAAVLAVGGAWLAMFAWKLGGASLLPVHDPFLPEAIAHE